MFPLMILPVGVFIYGTAMEHAGGPRSQLLA